MENKNTICLLVTVAAAMVLKVVKLFPVVGSWTGNFCAVPMVAPLLGLFGGLSGTGLLCAGLYLTRLFFVKAVSLRLLTYGLPTLFASFYFINNKAFKVLVPAVCMVLFVSHAVGAQAWAYSLFWLVPMVAAFVKPHNIMVQSLGSTFTAHAVGSVIWIYSGVTTPAMWLALIPVVVFERVLFAAGTTVSYHAICAVSKKIALAAKKYCKQYA